MEREMSIPEIRELWGKYGRFYDSIKGHDYASNTWVEGEGVLTDGRLYDMFVLKRQDGEFLRISVRPESFERVKVENSEDIRKTASLWKRMGYTFTYEELEFIMQSGARSPEELRKMLKTKKWAGRDEMLKKLDGERAD